LLVVATHASPRRVETLEDAWRTVLASSERATAEVVGAPDFDTSTWTAVSVPHNWDAYQGFRQLRHGNLHDSAWYRREFRLQSADRGRRIFLFFEGVGSYASVWVNGRTVGTHAGALTSFTLDVTDAVRFDAPNTLVVRADHPAGIRDLPWVCGGCEQAYGFSEGSQPLGIFRPVRLVVTAPVRIAPFGVHAWNHAPGADGRIDVETRSEVTNHDARAQNVHVTVSLLDARGSIVARSARTLALAPGATGTVALAFPVPSDVRLWSPERPYLHTVRAEVADSAGRVLDREDTPYGIRWIEWPDLVGPPDQPLRINGRPFFVNGVADYEHLLGGNHAFSDAQVDARVAQIRAAGFNAFRDAHHPHNPRFQQHWDRHGVLWWTQFGAHIWFDDPSFKNNYKRLLRDWIRERRNSPSLFLYGLQNESKLPLDFAAECVAIIRELDPTASTQRPITTCNGGKGTDWDVPQNWTGTYGGDPFAYAEDLRRQRLVGEYGAWRSLGHHSEGGYLPDGPLSEDRMTALMETKVRLAETVRDRVIGHFMWPFTTHSNPGRYVGELGQQTRDGILLLDQIGPANNKGLLTIWGEPVDAFHMYRSNYATAPMVYIVSHTWPDRWTTPGRKSGLIVYSNCDEVELFNDLRTRSLGVRTRDGPGTHFRWDDVPIETNMLYAEGRRKGKVVATDILLLHHLPDAPAYAATARKEPPLRRAHPDSRYVHRVNCGGPDHVDSSGALWRADRHLADPANDSYGSVSWAAAYANLDPAFGSQRRIHVPIHGTRDDALLQTYRYGREQLRWRFAVPPGDYDVELHFVEPWYGAGGGIDATGWRLFDVAVNGTTAIRDLDVWRESGGFARVLTKSIRTTAVDGAIEVSFPRVQAGQAVVSAIAIAARAGATPAAPPVPDGLLKLLDDASTSGWDVRTHLSAGDRVHAEGSATFAQLPPVLENTAWLRPPTAPAASRPPPAIRVLRDAELFVGVDSRSAAPLPWFEGWEPHPDHYATTEYPEVRFRLWRTLAHAGTAQPLGAFGSDVAPGIVFARPVAPIPPPQVIERFSSTVEAWKPAGNLRAGQSPFRGSGTTFTTIPPLLTDSDWIQTSDTSGDDVHVAFTAASDVEVHLAPDPRQAERPEWMEPWYDAGLVLRMSDTATSPRPLIKRRIRAGESAELGAAGSLPDGTPASPYAVVVRAVRPSFVHSLVSDPWALGAAEWEFEVGVGDRYGLNVRYRSSHDGELPFDLVVVDSEGREVCKRPMRLPGTDGAWYFLRTRTCASINAGTYRVRIALSPESGVEFDTIEVE
jgi:hypothetical protein